jgi:hypothetical protein
MLKKRYLIPLALAIISVLAGSLFYNNITQAQSGRFRMYKDSIEITVLDWAEVTIQSLSSGSRMDYGIMFLKDFPIKLAFGYSAKEQFQNVTNLWITILTPTYEHATTLWKFNITFNDKVTVSSGEFKLYPSSYHIKAVTLHIESPDVYQIVPPQINTLTLSSLMKKSYDIWEDAYLEIFKITLYIEYEYQAR